MSEHSIIDLIASARLGAEPADGDLLGRINGAVTGLDDTLGFRYIHVAEGRVVAEVEVDDRHLQPVGLVNGGVFAALAESTGSLAGIVAAGGEAVVGINNNTDFISAVRGGVIRAEATAFQMGRRTQLWQILMHNEDRLVARSTLRTMVL